MFIQDLRIKGFKGFKNEAFITFKTPNGEPGSGLNIFVGENNTGKSTAFEAIDYLRNGTKKDISDIKHKNSEEDARVEVTFQGDIESVINNFSQPNKVDVFKQYIFEEEGACRLRLWRSTEDSKQVKLWNNESKQYQNQSGIDAPVKKLFETNFVWADTNPNDEASFGATTICGNLLREIATNFTETAGYRDFSTKFHEVFNSQSSGLRLELIKIEEKVQSIFKELFGTAKISFHFEELKIDSFFKNSTIEIDDGIKTPMHEKGNGMQRAVALALLQVYAEELTKNPNLSEPPKPFFLFIDEPEICLHPNGQEKLLSALIEISKTKQIFLTTHSPYFLATKYLKNIGLHIFNKNVDLLLVEEASVKPLLPWSPSWGEINFRAYKLPTEEFHNELYGHLQETSSQFSLQAFDGWLNNNGIQCSKTWTKEKNGAPLSPEQVTLQTFIRNKIHHPENTTMRAEIFTTDELYQSICEMVAISESNGIPEG